MKGKIMTFEYTAPQTELLGSMDVTVLCNSNDSTVESFIEDDPIVW